MDETWIDQFQIKIMKTTPASKISSDDERARQLADIAASGDDDNAACAAADLAREFPSAAP